MEIENKRKELNDAIENNKSKSEILRISCELDKLIAQYIKFEK